MTVFAGYVWTGRQSAKKFRLQIKTDSCGRSPRLHLHMTEFKCLKFLEYALKWSLAQITEVLPTLKDVLRFCVGDLASVLLPYVRCLNVWIVGDYMHGGD